MRPRESRTAAKRAARLAIRPRRSCGCWGEGDQSLRLAAPRRRSALPSVSRDRSPSVWPTPSLMWPPASSRAPLVSRLARAASASASPSASVRRSPVSLPQPSFTLPFSSSMRSPIATLLSPARRGWLARQGAPAVVQEPYRSAVAALAPRSGIGSAAVLAASSGCHHLRLRDRERDESTRRRRSMLRLGWKAGTEQYPPDELLEYAVAAEAAGCETLDASDHFHPWAEAGQASFVWTWLGAVAARTSRIVLGPGVTCPILRYHPAIIGQAAATLACL